MRCSDLGTPWDIQPEVRTVILIPDLGCMGLLYMLCRHAMLVDQKSESVVVPLNTALGSSGKLELANSMWSIRGVSAPEDH